MMKAFFDDTANTGQSFYGFGGFLAEEQVWTDLRETWLKRNEFHNVSKFHASADPRLVPEYAELVLQNEIYLIGYTIDRESYRGYAVRRHRDLFGVNEWASVAEGCMDLLLDWLESSPDKKCALVFAKKKDFRGSITDMWRAIQKRRPNGKQLVSCTVTEDQEEFPLLQVADLGAYLTCKYTDARFYSGPVIDIAQKFHDCGRCKIMHFSAETIHKLANMETTPKTSHTDEIEDALCALTRGRE